MPENSAKNSAAIALPQDMSDSVFTETEMARAYREIGVRDPAFDMPAFLRQIKADVPTIIRAYLEGEIDVLKVPVPIITPVDGHSPAPCHASGIWLRSLYV
jgi:predicted lipid-binding transport protein (Tim44 family)